MGGRAGATAVASERAIEPADILRLATITDAHLSPDGRFVAFAVQRADRERNTYTSAIHVAAADGSGEPYALTAGERCKDTSPRWSPDGSRLAFVSDRSGKPQIYVADRRDGGFGGEARRLTNLERGATGPVWSPDGRRIAFVSSEGNGMADAERDRPGGTIRHVARLRYRFDVTGYIDDRFPHVWVVGADGGEPVQVTRGEQDDISPAWSPDGKRIAFVSNRLSDHSTLFRSQLYVVEASASGGGSTATDGAVRVDAGTEMAAAPAWSPDGTRIAYIGRREGAPAGANTAVYCAPANGGGAAENLSADFDRSPGTTTFSDTWSTMAAPATLFWGAAGDAVYFTACDEGRVSLFRTAAGRTEPVVAGDRTVGFASASADGRTLAYAAGSFTNPCDLYASAGDGSGERRLSRINAAVLDELPIQAPEAMPFESYEGGYRIDAWLYRPVGYEAGKRYPLVQIIHGGPHSVFGHTFFFDMQSWASAGYNVLFINPRASQGYGERFSTCNIGLWGEGDLPEQTAALDLAIERGGVDPDHLAVTGLSYGGYMTNWTIGHTDRYRAAVSENSISNLVSFYGTADIGWWFTEAEWGKPIWENLDFYMRMSPITYVEKMRTPTLFLNAETDWRCPIEQGEQLYTALKARGVPTELVRFPGESHAFLSSGKPESRLRRREHTLRWWKTYL